jgi:hypothetical protein
MNGHRLLQTTHIVAGNNDMRQEAIRHTCGGVVPPSRGCPHAALGNPCALALALSWRSLADTAEAPLRLFTSYLVW